MYLSLCEASYQIAMIVQDYVCDWRLNTLFARTVFWSEEIYYEVYATELLLFSSTSLSEFCMNMSMCLNTMLCLDLILMVRYPFQKKESRINKYVIYSVFMSVT